MNNGAPEKEIINKINNRGGKAFRTLVDCDEQGRNALMWAMTHNKAKLLGLGAEEWDYLITGSNLGQVGMDGVNPLGCAIINNKKEGLEFNERQWEYLTKHSQIKKIHLYYAIKHNERLVAKMIIERLAENYKIKHEDYKNHIRDTNRQVEAQEAEMKLPLLARET